MVYFLLKAVFVGITRRFFFGLFHNQMWFRSLDRMSSFLIWFLTYMYVSAFIRRSLAQTKIYVFALSVYLADNFINFIHCAFFVTFILCYHHNTIYNTYHSDGVILPEPLDVHVVVLCSEWFGKSVVLGSLSVVLCELVVFTLISHIQFIRTRQWRWFIEVFRMNMQSWMKTPITVFGEVVDL